MFRFLFLLFTTSLAAEELTLEKIHSEEGLTGPSLRSPKFSPNGRYVTYLKGRPDNARHYDLWSYDVITRHHRRWINSDDIFEGEEFLPKEEKARRERLRLNATGLVTYQWAGDNSGILFPLAGDLFFFELQTRSSKQITETAGFEFDAKLSPDGKKASFVRDQNIFVIELDTGVETALTTDGTGFIKNGVAEFVAQEEMGRHSGYWWSPDSKFIAFAQVNEYPVEHTHRSYIHAEGIDIIEQRYPFAGKNNAQVRLGVIDIGKTDTNWIRVMFAQNSYLARVDWGKTSDFLTFQWQSRNQQNLSLYQANHQRERSKLLLKEKSQTWINLHDDLRFLGQNDSFIWTSERSGFNHIYHFKDEKLTQLTQGDWPVNNVVHVDETNNWIYFTGWIDNPLENHLYRIPLKGGPPRKLSKRTGWHNVTFSNDGSHYVDNYTNDKQPTQISLHQSDGTLVDYLIKNEFDQRHPLTPFFEHWIDATYGILKAKDNTDLLYRVYRPTTPMPEGGYPAVVYVYGGPGSQQVRNSWSKRNLWFQYLLQKGYAVFTLDNRGSANRGKKFEEVLYKQLGKVELEDQLVGANWLKEQEWINSSRIGIYGHSYGGYMSLMAMFKTGDVFSCGIAGAPVTDFRLYDTHYSERYLGSTRANREGYESSSALKHSNGLQGDLLLYHGMADDNVLYQNATELVEKFQVEGKIFEFMAYPGAKHGISGPKNQLHLYRTIEDFFHRKIGSGRK